MSRAIKLKNNDYLDSSGIVHNKTKLNDMLNAKNLYINNDTFSDFTPRDINIDNVKKYKRIGIVYKYWKGDTQVLYSEFLTKYTGHKILGTYDWNAERRMNIYDNYINFENATVTVPPACDFIVQNGRLVIVEIMGYYF